MVQTELYDILYDDSKGHTFKYCVDSMAIEQARIYKQKCIDRYVGKPWPNGKGFYDVHNVRIRRSR